MKIKIPPMPDVVNAWSIQTTGDLLECLLQDRDQQWLELVGPVVEALKELLVDMRIAQANMRRAAVRDPSWDGCSEAIQPRVDAASSALRAITEEQS